MKKTLKSSREIKKEKQDKTIRQKYKNKRYAHKYRGAWPQADRYIQ